MNLRLGEYVKLIQHKSMRSFGSHHIHPETAHRVSRLVLRHFILQKHTAHEASKHASLY